MTPPRLQRITNPSPDSEEPTASAYPRGTVRALLASDLVTPPTRQVLEARLQASEEIRDAAPTPRFFDDTTFATLEAVCARLLAIQAEEIPSAREVAVGVDARLAERKGNGWRYDSLPADGDAYRRGLTGLDETVRLQHRRASFAAATSDEQETVLRWVRDAAPDLPGEIWQGREASRFFEELLAEVAEIYYSHPLAQEEIGYVGMADARGWKRFGLNVLEFWEPKPNVPYSLPASSDAPPNPSPHDAGEIILLPTIAAAEEAAALIPETPRALPPRSRSAAPLPNPSPVDVVVIGTGAGGSPILARLAQAGFSVVALEAGKFWEPVRDFATDERAQSDKLFWMDERLSAGNDPVAFGNNNSGIGVGGSTLHFTAYTPRPHPDDFRLHADFGVGADWPLTYEALEPYLTEVEQFLGVSGPTAYPWGGPRSGGYPLPPLPLNGAALLMERGCREIGLRTSPAPNAALSAPYSVEGVGMRKACTNRGFCQAGCSVGAKSSMDVTYIPLALANGAEVRSECFVTRIETDSSKSRVTSIVYQQEGQELRQACRAVFLCAGAIESPRLLLLNGLGNADGQVGRHFMAHPGIQLWSQFEEDIRPYKGIPGGLISEDTHRPKDADFAGGYLLQSIGVMPVTYASQFARGERVWGEALREHLAGYNHVAGINILGEGLPYDHNYLELSDEKDERGLPKPRVHYTAGENEQRMTAHADRTMRAIWDAAGAKRNTWSFQRFAHTLGTCRMGQDARSSVVNPDARIHDLQNLFVCDNSVFPSALAVNPALTQIALSLRTADHFIAAARQGGI
ncbi:MAG: GMC family oxidoreductase N-terminal domain-containing protein [Cytophagales bacterium]|nr:GMC family oxidoreductase N-terminal domain-containing protein [Armatimonadota bacterium]